MVVYVTEQGAIIRKRGERLRVEMRGEEVCEILMIDLQALVIMGNVQLTTQAARMLMERGIDVTFLSLSGQFKGKICGLYNRNIFLRMAQYKAYQSKREMYARAFVTGKIQNQITVLKRSEWGNKSERKYVLDEGIHALILLDAAETINEILGIEGRFANQYFSVFGEGINKDYTFKQRVKHPAYDPVNAMLNFGYSLLINDIICQLDLTGFEVAIGFLHSLHYGRASLACDLIEEFRAPLVDRLIIKIINKAMIQKSDFQTTLEGCRLIEEKRRWFIQMYRESFKQYEKIIQGQVSKLRKALLAGEGYVAWSLSDTT